MANITENDARAHGGRSRTNSGDVRRNFRREAMIDGACVAIAIGAAASIVIVLLWVVLEASRLAVTP